MNIKDYENVLWNSIKDDLKTMVNIAERKPKTTKDPKYNEKTIHHIHANNCIAKCLTCKSGMCLNGFLSAFITPSQLS